MAPSRVLPRPLPIGSLFGASYLRIEGRELEAGGLN
jgi:hypothetical protein